MVRAGPLSSEDQSLVLVCPEVCPFRGSTGCSGSEDMVLAMSLHLRGAMGKLCWDGPEGPLPSFPLLEPRKR